MFFRKETRKRMIPSDSTFYWTNTINNYEDCSLVELISFATRMRIDTTKTHDLILPKFLTASDQSPDDGIISEILDMLSKESRQIYVKENYIKGHSQTEINCIHNMQNAIRNDPEAINYTYLCKNLVGFRTRDHVFPAYKTGNVITEDIVWSSLTNKINAIKSIHALLNVIHKNKHLVLNLRRDSIGYDTERNAFLLHNFAYVTSLEEYIKQPSMIMSSINITLFHFLLEMQRSSREPPEMEYSVAKDKFLKFFEMVAPRFECQNAFDIGNTVFNAALQSNYFTFDVSNIQDYCDLVFTKLLNIQNSNPRIIVRDPKKLLDNLQMIDKFSLGSLIMHLMGAHSIPDILNLPDDIRTILYNTMLMPDIKQEQDQEQQQKHAPTQSQSQSQSQPRKIRINNQERVVRRDNNGDYIIFKGTKVYLDKDGIPNIQE